MPRSSPAVLSTLRPRLLKLAFDGLLVAAAWYLAFWLRFDPALPPPYHRLLTGSLPLVVAVELAVFVAAGFYRRWWRYTSLADVWGLARGVTIAALAAALAVYLARPVRGFPLPRSVALLDWLILLALVCGTRLVSRSWRDHAAPHSEAKTVLVVGAGDAGQLVVKELLRPHSRYHPLGYVDDDPRKRGMSFQGLKVLGAIEDLDAVLRRLEPDEVLIAVPSASGDLRRRVVAAARQQDLPVKTLPSLHELLAGDLELARQIRPVKMEDLLGRDPVEIDLDQVASYLTGARVLVTGAGGSIGAELCRQIARYLPERLTLVDRAESSLYLIARELEDERRFSAFTTALVDCGDEEAVEALLAAARPQVVFHAAAYKHVPLLEEQAVAAVRNNVLATRVVARAAYDAGVERFVLVSTDKAARPTSLMGRTKALSEWIVESYGRRDGQRFVAVRFGNVLGSAGSVIPLWERQIAYGGPVTVTHPDMTRFFMTIPEAVALIVQAGAIGEGGEVFVLDMGQPMRIVELAENMVQLLAPDREIELAFTGARPGEKLHEELWEPGEDVVRTSHPLILRSTRRPVAGDWLTATLDELAQAAQPGRDAELRAKLAALAPARLALGQPEG